MSKKLSAAAAEFTPRFAALSLAQSAAGSAGSVGAPLSPPAGGARRKLALDVECVATGPGHNDRGVAQIALVDEHGQVVLDVFVRPTGPVTSYLTALTGIDNAQLAGGLPLADALTKVYGVLGPDVALVGHALTNDLRWLNLKAGVHYSNIFDVSQLWQAYNPQYRSNSYFALEHLVRVLLKIGPEGMHDAAMDAQLSMALLDLHTTAQGDGTLAAKQQLLLDTPALPSFKVRHPIYEGVCMGVKKKCLCGQPFFQQG